jgi:hypothetical protein
VNTHNKQRNLLLSSAVFTSLLIIWPVMAALSLPEGTLNEQILSVKGSFLLHGFNFVIALFIAPALLWMFRSLYPLIADKLPKRWLSMTIFFYILYFLLITISYGSQVFYLPWILDTYPSMLVRKWFFYNTQSIAYLLNQSGYLSWSIGTFFFLLPVVFAQKKLLKVAFLIFLFSAMLQTFASIGAYLNYQPLAGLSFISGTLLFPAGVLLVIFSLKIRF